MRWAWAAVLLVGCLPQHSCQADLVDGEFDGGGGGVGGDGAGGDGVGGGDVSRCAFVDRAPTLDPAVDIRTGHHPFLYWDGTDFVLLASQDGSDAQCTVDQRGAPQTWRITASGRDFKAVDPLPMCASGCGQCSIYNVAQDADGVLVALLSDDNCDNGWERLAVHALAAGQTDCRAEAAPPCEAAVCTDYPGEFDVIGPVLDADRRGAFVPFHSMDCGDVCLDVGLGEACGAQTRCVDDGDESWVPAGRDAIVTLDDLTVLLLQHTSGGTPFPFRLITIRPDGSERRLTDTVFERDPAPAHYQDGFIGRVGDTDRLWLVWREGEHSLSSGMLRVGQTAAIDRATGFLEDAPDRVLDPDVPAILSFAARATPEGLAVAAVTASGAQAESIEWLFYDNAGNLSASARLALEPAQRGCIDNPIKARLQLAPSIDGAEKRFAMTWACDDEARYAEVRCAAAD